MRTANNVNCNGAARTLARFQVLTPVNLGYDLWSYVAPCVVILCPVEMPVSSYTRFIRRL